MSKIRYEAFGGLIRTENPPATIFVDKQYMKNLGYTDSNLWEKDFDYLSAPIDAHFALTNRCPLECRYCYKSSMKDEQDLLSLTEIKKIINTLADMKVFSVAFGGGEPFAREDIFEIAKYTRLKGITPNVTTNGFYINSSNAEKCKIFGHMHVSLDLPNENFDKIKAKGAFNAADKAIDLLVREGIHVGINCVVSQSNYEHLEELVKYCLSKDIHDIAILGLKPVGRADKLYDKMKLSNEQNKNLFLVLKKLKRKYKVTFQADCSMVPMLAYHKPSFKLINFFGVEGCTGGNTFIEIKEDGAVRSCSFSNFFGDNAENLKDIWTDSDYFTKFRNVIDTPRKPCNGCKYLIICRGGCHVISEHITVDFNNPDPECPLVVKYREKNKD
ncbi:MAG: radical SAM/SPASM domain-containing protein [Candidatus Heimdallarchaeaceae archaeon]